MIMMYELDCYILCPLYLSRIHSLMLLAPAHANSDFFEEAFNYIAYKGKFRGEAAAESLY
jgi:hypothetical protein